MSALLFHAGNEETIQAVALGQELDERPFMAGNGKPLRRVFYVEFRMILQKAATMRLFSSSFMVQVL